MHPVVKHGNNGKWERIKDKPTFYVSFLSKFPFLLITSQQKNLIKIKKSENNIPHEN
jgi:hypothetical protein